MRKADAPCRNPVHPRWAAHTCHTVPHSHGAQIQRELKGRANRKQRQYLSVKRSSFQRVGRDLGDSAHRSPVFGKLFACFDDQALIVAQSRQREKVVSLGGIARKGDRRGTQTFARCRARAHIA